MTIWPLNETLRRIEPYLSPRLVSPSAFSHIRTIAQSLPDASYSYGLECRLSSKSPQTDFALCVHTANSGREVFARSMKEGRLPVAFLEQPIWRRVSDFFAAWTQPDSLLYEKLPLIFLSFDVEGSPSAVPQPCLHFCLDYDFLRRCNRESDDRSSGFMSQLTSETYRALVEVLLPLASLDARQGGMLENVCLCRELLPPGGSVVYISILSSRNPPVLKINVVVPKKQTLSYLRDIGWTGEGPEVEGVMSEFDDLTGRARLDLTIGEAISPRIGVEFFSTASLREEGRKFFLDRCVERGRCTPEKRDALLNWTGSSQEVFDQHTWGTCLSRAWYVKMISEPRRPIELKGYLWFMPHLFSPFSQKD